MRRGPRGEEEHDARRYGNYTASDEFRPMGLHHPMDGPVGDLISPRTCRLAIFTGTLGLLVTATGHQPFITHLFEGGAEYLDSDVVFGDQGRARGCAGPS